MKHRVIWRFILFDSDCHRRRKEAMDHACLPFVPHLGRCLKTTHLREKLGVESAESLSEVKDQPLGRNNDSLPEPQCLD